MLARSERGDVGLLYHRLFSLTFSLPTISCLLEVRSVTQYIESFSQSSRWPLRLSEIGSLQQGNCIPVGARAEAGRSDRIWIRVTVFLRPVKHTGLETKENKTQKMLSRLCGICHNHHQWAHQLTKVCGKYLRCLLRNRSDKHSASWARSALAQAL